MCVYFAEVRTSPAGEFLLSLSYNAVSRWIFSTNAHGSGSGRGDQLMDDFLGRVGEYLTRGLRVSVIRSEYCDAKRDEYGRPKGPPCVDVDAPEPPNKPTQEAFKRLNEVVKRKDQ
jgi:hypothetical protein